MFQKVLCLFAMYFTVNGQNNNYDIYQVYSEQLLLKSYDYFSSGSLVYPGLQSTVHRDPQKQDTVTNLKHCIIGYKDIENDEMSGTTIVQPYYKRMGYYYDPSPLYSELSRLYFTLAKENTSCNTGFYLGSLQLNSENGDLPAYRYGLMTAVFAEQKRGFFGGVSAAVHADKMNRFNLLREHDSRYYPDSVFISGWLDREQQRYSDVSLSLFSSVFPFGRSENEKKMFLLDLYGAHKIDSISDTLRETYGFPDTLLDTIIPAYRTIPHSINQYSFEYSKASGGISFVWLNTARFFMKVRLGAMYSRCLTGTFSDVTIVKDEYLNGNYFYEEKGHEKLFNQAIFDTTGLELGIKEYVKFKQNPFTFLLGFDGTVNIEIFRNQQEKGFKGNLRYFRDHNCIKNYDLEFPIAVWWEKGDFALHWSCYPEVNRTWLIYQNSVKKTINWSLQQVSLGCTIRLQKFSANYTPVFKNGSVNFRNAELHYTGENK